MEWRKTKIYFRGQGTIEATCPSTPAHLSAFLQLAIESMESFVTINHKVRSAFQWDRDVYWCMGNRR